MTNLILTGIGYGLLLSVMVGPAFFVLIETSIVKGVKAALFFDLGVLLSDIMYLALALLFFQEVNDFRDSGNEYILRLVGGTFFIIFGILNLTKKKIKLSKKELLKPQQLSASNYVMTLIKGFTFNAVNPGVLFYWFTLLSLLPAAPTHLGLSREQAVMIYLAIILITFFSIDVLKIFGAKKLKEILTPEWMRVVNLVLGIVLICFGTLFLVQGIVQGLKMT